MENVILYGNGLNLLSNDLSWKDLLTNISSTGLIEEVPYTMLYESIILDYDYYKHIPIVTKDNYILTTADNKELHVIDKPREEVIKENIKNELKKLKPNFAYDRLGKLDVEHYITTNYDKTLHSVLESHKLDIIEKNNSESTYSIKRYIKFRDFDNQKEKNIWSMHGSIDCPNSIMLGLDHYCGSVGKINDYLKGKYEYTKNGKKNQVPDIITRLTDEKMHSPLSWIDLFFTHDIHIIGFGLQYEEVDLWWILNKRQRYKRKFAHENLINNKIFYYGNVDCNKEKLLNKFGVQVYSLNSKRTKDYTEEYQHYIDVIESYINNSTNKSIPYTKK